MADEATAPVIYSTERLGRGRVHFLLAEVDGVLRLVRAGLADRRGGFAEDAGDAALLVRRGVEFFGDRPLERAACLVHLRHDAGDVAIGAALFAAPAGTLEPVASARHPAADLLDAGGDGVDEVPVLLEMGAAGLGDGIGLLVAFARR